MSCTQTAVAPWSYFSFWDCCTFVFFSCFFFSSFFVFVIFVIFMTFLHDFLSVVLNIRVLDIWFLNFSWEIQKSNIKHILMFRCFVLPVRSKAPIPPKWNSNEKYKEWHQLKWLFLFFRTCVSCSSLFVMFVLALLSFSFLARFFIVSVFSDVFFHLWSFLFSVVNVLGLKEWGKTFEYLKFDIWFLNFQQKFRHQMSNSLIFKCFGLPVGPTVSIF